MDALRDVLGIVAGDRPVRHLVRVQLLIARALALVPRLVVLAVLVLAGAVVVVPRARRLRLREEQAAVKRRGHLRSARERPRGRSNASKCPADVKDEIVTPGLASVELGARELGKKKNRDAQNLSQYI